MQLLDKLDIRESISDKETVVLESLTNEVKEQGATFVEIGSWKGHSASIIGERVKELQGTLYCIDHWQGNQFTSNLGEARVKDIYHIFEHNLKTLGLWEYIIPMVMDSVSANKGFKDNSIDFLFIDADHRYEPFIADLKRWLPKVRVGGIICGHDCECYFANLPMDVKERISNIRDSEYDGTYHVGVVKGLYDFFGDDYRVAKDTRIWFKVV